MTDWLQSPYLILFARLTLGGIFLFGAVGKWLDPAGSQAAVAQRTWIPAPLAQIGGRVLPFVEAAVGALLMLGLGLGLVAWLALLMLVGFTITVLADLAGGQAMPCHCFGSFSRENVSPWSVARNVLLGALAALVAWHPLPYLALDGLFGANAGGALPPAVNAVPVVFLALITVVAIVLGSLLVQTVRAFLRAF